MPARAPDPHNLRRAAAAAGAHEVYEHDRPCIGCGYNLRGVRRGANCPECGMASKMPDDIDAPLSLAPTRVIVLFIQGCWLASICVGALLVVTIADRVPAWKPLISLSIIAGVSLLWALAVMWLTPGLNFPQAAIRGFSPRGKLRRLTRWLQWGWVAWAGARFGMLIVPASAPGSIHSLLSMAESAGFIAGLAGVVCLCLMLERLAEWARDDTAEKFFNWSAWSLPLSTLLVGVHFSQQIYVNMLITVVWMVSMGIFPYALLNLSGSVTFSALHSVEHKGRQERRAERDNRYNQAVGRTVKAMDAARRNAGHV